MSSVKRRKVDDEVPSDLLKSKNHMVNEALPISASTSEGSAGEDPEDKIEAEATKTFKDLVRVSDIAYCKLVAYGI
jgi:hypothetical protein